VSGWKKVLLLGLGYAAFFVAVFIPALYFTFEPNALGQMLQSEAGKYQVGLETGVISRSGLATFKVSDFRLSLPPRHGGKAPPPFLVNHLTFKPQLRKLPGLVIAAIRGRPPPLGLDFSATIDTGRLRGKFEAGSRDFSFALSIGNLPLTRVTLPGVFIEEMNLSGTLAQADIRLSSPDRDDLSQLAGKVKIEFGPFGISDFRYYGVKIGGMNFEPGGLIDADIEEGVIALNAFQINGDLSPDIKGTIRLRKNLAQSTVNLRGKIPYSPEYRERFPNIAVYIPSPDSFVYNEPLSLLIGSP